MTRAEPNGLARGFLPRGQLGYCWAKGLVGMWNECPIPSSRPQMQPEQPEEKQGRLSKLSAASHELCNRQAAGFVPLQNAGAPKRQKMFSPLINEMENFVNEISSS